MGASSVGHLPRERGGSGGRRFDYPPPETTRMLVLAREHAIPLPPRPPSSRPECISRNTSALLARLFIYLPAPSPSLRSPPCHQDRSPRGILKRKKKTRPVQFFGLLPCLARCFLVVCVSRTWVSAPRIRDSAVSDPGWTAGSKPCRTRWSRK